MKTGTTYYGDCLDLMTQWKEKQAGPQADMIYLDPPFNSNANYGVLYKDHADSKETAPLTMFTDMWTWNAAAKKRVDGLCRNAAHPANEVIRGMRIYLGKSGMLSYVSYMAERLALMQELLKTTGSIFFHCDPTASHYIKTIMDAIFGAQNFCNEIVWKRTSSRMTKRKFPSIHDTILFYANGEDNLFNKVFLAHDPEYIRKFYRHEDEFGLYMIESLTGPGVTKKGDSGKPWRGIDPSKVKRHWAAPGTFPDHVVKPADWDAMSIHQKLDHLDSAGLIYWPAKGDIPRFKRYLSTSKGAVLNDMILDVPPLSAHSKERLGFPTQKRMALIERFIKATTNPGDIVLDPFCGCGTTLEAAHKLGRQWVGIDVSLYCVKAIAEDRMSEAGIPVLIDGIPKDPAQLLELAKTNPFAFESFAVESILGLVANKIQQGDRGMDGKGFLLNKTTEGKDLVIAQVTTGKPSIDKVKAFAQTIRTNEAASGVFITPAGKGWTKGMDEVAAELGTFKQEYNPEEYPVMQHWSAEKQYGEVWPKLPPRVNIHTKKPFPQDNLLLAK